MLYREAFLPPGPSPKEPYGPLAREKVAMSQRPADAESQTFNNPDEAITK